MSSVQKACSKPHRKQCREWQGRPEILDFRVHLPQKLPPRDVCSPETARWRRGLQHRGEGSLKAVQSGPERWSCQTVLAAL